MESEVPIHGCPGFRQRLDAYLEGALPPADFDAMAEHEASCPACHELAVDRQSKEAPMGPPGEGLRIGRDVFGRTIGSDCEYVARRLAEIPDLARAVVRGAAVEETGVARMQSSSTEVTDPEDLTAAHLRRCASCRRLRDVLQDLPAMVACVPRLRADRSFTAAVLRRTSGLRPSVADVLRALWARPEAMWEAALACTLVTMMLFGNTLAERTPGHSAGGLGQLQQAAVQSAGETIGGIGAFVIGRGSAVLETPVEAVRKAYDTVLRQAGSFSGWAEQTRTDLREGDWGGLLLDMRAALSRIGLDPIPADPATEDGRIQNEGGN